MNTRSLLLTFVMTSAGVVVSAQSPVTATDVPREELQKVVAAAIAARRGDQAARVVDAGGYNVGVSIVRRTSPGSTVNHTKITEVYYIVSGSGTLMTGGDVTNETPLDPNSDDVKILTGPSNRATFVRVIQRRIVKAGDVVIIPAGVYHGFSEVPDHIEYVTIRVDPQQILPSAYVHPALKP
jgi:mannose-6-phosphate isomerase-like protein (cupin superfamily)